ncbi:MAG: Lrp/AsnC ligand binding domain-containing protein [Candidatus Hadarchaeales archaeon]
MRALVYVRTAAGKALGIADKIRKVKGVSEVYATTGRFDLVVLVEAEDVKKLGETVVNGIQKVGGVQSTETALIVE